jgi:hypothetical protein
MKLGLDMRPFRQRCGNWLRSDVRAQFRKDIFTKAASTMRKLHKDAQRLKTQRTGQLGTILPVAGEGPLRSRPVQVKTPGGLIIPAGTSLH